MNFPRVTFPAIVVGSNLVNNTLLLAAVLGIFVLLGHPFRAAMLWILPLTAIAAAFAAGIGLSLGVMNVFVRDIGQVVPILLQIWFWFTPIVYPSTIIPESYRKWLQLNPAYHLVEAYHRGLMYGTAPEFKGVAVVVVVSLGLLLTALFLFLRAAEEMVDVL